MRFELLRVPLSTFGPFPGISRRCGSSQSSSREEGSAQLASRSRLPCPLLSSPSFQVSFSCCRELLWIPVHDSLKLYCHPCRPPIPFLPVPRLHPACIAPTSTRSNSVLTHSSFIQHPDFALVCAHTHPSAFPHALHLGSRLQV